MRQERKLSHYLIVNVSYVFEYFLCFLNPVQKILVCFTLEGTRKLLRRSFTLVMEGQKPDNLTPVLPSGTVLLSYCVVEDSSQSG